MLDALGLPPGLFRSLLHTVHTAIMPPACPVDTYVLSYRSEERNDPPGKPVAFRVVFDEFRGSED